ncbi:hypothetical protein ACIOD2_46730 [Amycolatopsis sp. NPDC088138]|uniref:hypothetical protein n=1 Tax=Amycolatopsis sp. NPDC088138 TaxID=3363938 RepID=UPI0037F40C05
MPERRSPDRITFSRDPNYVGFDELFEAAAEPTVETSPGIVLEPACRKMPRRQSQMDSPHPGWELLRQIMVGNPAHAWRSALLLVVVGTVICGILLAGSVALSAAGTALMALVGLLRLSRWQADRARLG